MECPKDAERAVEIIRSFMTATNQIQIVVVP